MSRLIRKYIAELLLGWSLDVMPESKKKTELAIFIISFFEN